MKKYLSISQTANLLGVSKDTLRRWENSGKLTANRTPSGYRVYSEDQIKSLKSNLSKPQVTDPIITKLPKTFNVSEAAMYLNVSKDTIRRWESVGKITSKRTPSGYRVFDSKAIQDLKNSVSFGDRVSFAPSLSSDTSNPSPVISNEVTDLSPSVTLSKAKGISRGSYPSPTMWDQDDERAARDDSKNQVVDLRTELLGSRVEETQVIIPEYFEENLTSKIAKSKFKSTGVTLALCLFLFLTIFFSSKYIAGDRFSFIVDSLLVDSLLGSGSTSLTKYSLSPSTEAQDKLSRSVAFNLAGSVLAATAPSGRFLEINADTKVNGSLFGIEGVYSGELVSSTLDTGFGANELYPMDQGVTTTGSPTFASLNLGTLNLTSGSNQIVIGGLSITSATTSTVVATIPTLTSDDSFAFSNNTQTFTNKSLSGSANTLTNIPNGALSNSKITISAGSGLSGGGDVSLGSSVSLAVSGVTASNISADSLDFSEFKDLMTLDATTDIATAGFNLTTSGSGAISFANTGTFTVSGATTLSSTLAVTGDSTLTGDLAVNGGDLTTTATTFNLLNSTATTINFGGGATTALNIGNGNTAYTAINIGSGTGADTINIGTGGTGADTITIGSSASSTSVAVTTGTGSQTHTSNVATGTTTTSGFVFDATAITSGTGMYLVTDSLTSGRLLDIATTGNTWTGNSTTSGLVNLASTSTAGTASDSDILLNIARSGANAQLAHTAYGLYSTVTNTNATSGTNIAGYFSASGATTANYGLIVAAGNVGIGTTTPTAKLEVYGGYNQSLDWNLVVRNPYNDNTDTSYGTGIKFKLSSDASANEQNKWAGIAGIPGANQAASTALAFYTAADPSVAGAVEKMRITGAGNVGIGTTIPNDILEVTDASTNQLFLRDNRTMAIDQGGGLTFKGFKTGTSAQAEFASIKGLKENITSANEAGYLAFAVNDNVAGSPVERMRITSGGNVGIGTTGPASNQGFAYALELNDTGATTGWDLMLTNPTAGTDEFLGQLSWNHANDGLAAIAAKTDGATDAGHLEFQTQPTGGAITERMRITSAGNVGIGTTAPNTRLGQKLDIATSANYGGAMLSTWSTTAAQGSVLDLARSKSATIGTQTALANNDTVGFFAFRGSDGTAFQDVAFIQGDVDGTVATNQVPGRMMFWTTSAAGTATERMRIDKAGNVGIGTTNPTYKLTIAPQSGSIASLLHLRTDIDNGRNLTFDYTDQASTAGVYQIATDATSGFAFTGGNVGIGTTVPGYLLHAYSASSGVAITAETDSTTAYAGYEIAAGSASAFINTSQAVGYLRAGAGGMEVARFQTSGVLDVNGAVNANAFDVAEMYEVKDNTEPGDLVVQSTSGGPVVEKSNTSYQNSLLGIVSSEPGVNLGGSSFRDIKPNEKPIALAGRVPTKVSTENGPIEPGDYLTSSSIPGVAMKATRPGPTVGKAQESFREVGVGKILVFVNVSYADPNGALAKMSLDENGDLEVPSLKVKNGDSEYVNVGTLLAELNTKVENLETTQQFSLDSEGNVTIPELRVGKLTLDPSLMAEGTANENGTLSYQIMDLENRVRDLENGSINPNGPSFSEQLAALNSVTASQTEAVSEIATGLSGLRNDVSSQSAQIAEASSEIRDTRDEIRETSNRVDELKTQILALLSGQSSSSSSAVIASEAKQSETEIATSPTAPRNDDIAELNLTPPDIMMATGSATLANLEVSEKITAVDISTLEMTVSGVFRVFGDSFIGNTNVAGELTQDGTFSISNGNSINVIGLDRHVACAPRDDVIASEARQSCTSGILYFQNSPLALGVDFFNGQVTIDNSGLLKADTVVVAEFKVVAGKTTGTGKILAGKNKVEILNPLIKANSRILITPTTNTFVVLAVTEKMDGQKFVVSSPVQISMDTSFDYWILNEVNQ